MNMKRMRGRSNRGPSGGGGGSPPIRHNSGNIPLNRNHVFDSSGPDMRVRGTAQQLFEKYLQLGRDASSSGDRVMAEGYFQHAEHYFRIISAINQAQQQSQPQQGSQQNGAQQNGSGQNGHQNANQQNHRRDQDHADQGQDDGDDQPGDAPAELVVELREIPIMAAPTE